VALFGGGSRWRTGPLNSVIPRLLRDVRSFARPSWLLVDRCNGIDSLPDGASGSRDRGARAGRSGSTTVRAAPSTLRTRDLLLLAESERGRGLLARCQLEWSLAGSGRSELARWTNSSVVRPPLRVSNSVVEAHAMVVLHDRYLGAANETSAFHMLKVAGGESLVCVTSFSASRRSKPWAECARDRS